MCANSSGGGLAKKSAPRFHATASEVGERDSRGANGLQGEEVDERELVCNIGDEDPNITRSGRRGVGFIRCGTV
jgi:hypothetical protein